MSVLREWSKSFGSFEEAATYSSMINHSIVSTRELNCSVKQRTGAAGESRGGLHTLPNRHRPKPSDNRNAMLGKLSSLILGNDCANRAQSAYLLCTMPRCSQSKRHNRAAGSCRKLSYLPPILFCRQHLCYLSPKPPFCKGGLCWLW